jgi:hypothetical protein
VLVRYKHRRGGTVPTGQTGTGETGAGDGGSGASTRVDELAKQDGRRDPDLQK